MRLKWCVVITALFCILMGTLSGCSTKEDENNSISKSKETAATDEKESSESIPITQLTESEIVTADYAEEFQSIHGCAVIFDSARNTYTFYNAKDCRIQVSPCSTFKVISTLMGLHNQVIISKESRLGYNGTNYPMESWNADLDLQEAFQNSCVWYFRKVIDGVGQEEVQKELDALNYGNCDISEWNGSNTNQIPELNGFWLDSSLKISPIEQVDLLRNIIEGNTVYTKEEVNILKDIMLIETSSAKKIYGKTGTGMEGNAWFVGFVENEGSDVFFAVYLNDNTADVVNGAKAKEIALSILME